MLRNGYWKYYWKNGILKESGNHTNDQKTGTWYFYSEKGDLIKQEAY